MNLVSPYVISIVLGWSIAQLTKYIARKLSTKKLSAVKVPVFLSGGMPSAHTTTVFALLTVVTLIDGVQSAVFGLSLLLALIVAYDSARLRRAVGEQGVAVGQLVKERKSKVSIPAIVLGHTPAQVIAGAILGIIIGLVVFLATNWQQ